MYVNGKEHDFVGEEADQLRERFVTLFRVGQRVINFATVTEIILSLHEDTRPGSPVRVVYVNGKEHDFVGEEADQLREKLAELVGAERPEVTEPRP